MGAAILLPAILIMIVANRVLLAVADGSQLVPRKSHGRQVLLGLLSTCIAQRHIVFLGTALVAVPLHGQLEVGKLTNDFRQSLGIRPESGLGVRAQSVL